MQWEQLPGGGGGRGGGGGGGGDGGGEGGGGGGEVMLPGAGGRGLRTRQLQVHCAEAGVRRTEQGADKTCVFKGIVL